MRVFNRFLDKGAGTYNDPERADFYINHKIFLTISGITAMIGALSISFLMGRMVFAAMAGLSLLGVIYSIPLVPRSVRHLWRYTKMRDIPGSKNLLEALAWAAVIVLTPLLEPFPMHWAKVTVTFLFVLMTVFVRAAFFDILEVQGDLVVGVETLPITIGEKKTMILLKAFITSAALILITAPIIKATGPFSFLMLLPLMGISFLLNSYEKGRIQHGPLLEYLIEGNFLLAGILGVIRQTVL